MGTNLIIKYVIKNSLFIQKFKLILRRMSKKGIYVFVKYIENQSTDIQMDCFP